MRIPRTPMQKLTNSSFSSHESLSNKVKSVSSVFNSARTSSLVLRGPNTSGNRSIQRTSSICAGFRLIDISCV